MTCILVHPLLVWTRMQAEAGQGLAAIVARKERERRLNGGTFLWGVGSAPARAVRRCAEQGSPLPVVFSTMLSKPKATDSNPDEIVAWTRIVGVDGRAHALPSASVVTSRWTGRPFHQALHCLSDTPLTLGDHGPFDPTAHRNAGEGGGPVGASQVTSLLKRIGPDGESTPYRIAMTATLVDAMWTKLLRPVPMGPALRAALDDHHDDASWMNLCRTIGSQEPVTTSGQSDLFT